MNFVKSFYWEIYNQEFSEMIPVVAHTLTSGVLLLMLVLSPVFLLMALLLSAMQVAGYAIMRLEENKYLGMDVTAWMYKKKKTP